MIVGCMNWHPSGHPFPWRECKRAYSLWVRPLSVYLPKEGRKGAISTEGLLCPGVPGGPQGQGP